MTSYGAEHLIPFCSFQKHPFEYKEQKHTEHPALCHTYVLIFFFFKLKVKRSSSERINLKIVTRKLNTLTPHSEFHLLNPTVSKNGCG